MLICDNNNSRIFYNLTMSLCRYSRKIYLYYLVPIENLNSFTNVENNDYCTVRIGSCRKLNISYEKKKCTNTFLKCSN